MDPQGAAHGHGLRDLPARFGPWQSVYAGFRSWTRSGLWQALLTALSSTARDDEYLMVDSTALRVHAHGANPAGGQLAQAIARSRASLSTKVHLACDALGYPLGFILTGANVSDFDQARPLLDAYLRPGAHVPMDKGYDSDALRAYVNQQGGVAVIAVRRTKTVKPPFDEHLYRERHRIEPLRQAQDLPSAGHPLRKAPLLLRRHARHRLRPSLAQILNPPFHKQPLARRS